VEYVFKTGLMTGTSTAPMLFSPDTAMTRGMTVTAFYHIAGSPDTRGFVNPYDDVGAGKWYGDAVKWAAASGLVNGVGNGKFAPDREITREETAVVFYNYQRLSGVIPPDVSEEIEPKDAGEISEWAREATKKLMAQMIFLSTDDSFVPKGEVTRVEFAGMLRDYYENSKDATDMQ
jgi:hypothetical protein